MRRIVYSDRARRELIEIFVWIARDNMNAANRVLARIEATVEGLADFSTGRQVRLADTFDKVVVGQPYIVTYSIVGSVLTILTVRHTSRRPLGES